MSGYQPDQTGAREAIRIARLIEPWGDARFPVDVDMLALGWAATFQWDDPVTQVYGETWDGIEGALIPKSEGKEWWIVYSTRSSPERQRFTKAHELGHYLLHRNQQALFHCGSALIWERDAGTADIEAQANQFASYLLMPANHVREKLRGQTITLELLGDLATFYGVSLAAIFLKFVEITDRRAVVMYWDNGFLKWCVPSRKARLSRARYLKSAALIEPPPGSLAADESVRQEWEGQRIPAQTWFPTESRHAFLREMKHVSDTYERVLSLLILPEAEAPWERDEKDDD